jgi:flavin reductase (DIM6/NTAB) family NADH-FMN oxidoreductase RutF
MHAPTHLDIEPAIHYWGTPVVLVGTRNPDGSANLAPMSSAWWLGWSCMLGLDASSQTTENLRRTGQCVLNLADAGMVAAVDRLALLTGSAAVPIHKQMLGYRHEADKFSAAGLTAQAAVDVDAPRVRECQVQLEASVVDMRPFAAQDPRMPVAACMVELRLSRVHVAPELLHPSDGQRIDPDRWRPLIMSFRQFHSVGPRLQASKLAEAPEAFYAPWRRTRRSAAAGTCV